MTRYFLEFMETNIIERAFGLASECGSIAEIERRLIREGYLNVSAHLRGRQIRQQLISRLNPELKHVMPRRIPAARQQLRKRAAH